MQSKIERTSEKRINDKLTYRWNGSCLYPEPDLQYTYVNTRTFNQYK